MIKEQLGDRLEAWLPRLLPFVFRAPLSAHGLTWLGTAICLAAAVLYARGELLAGGLVLALGGFCDLVDGMVARQRGTASRYGAFLDSSLDRVVDMAVPLGLMLHYAGEDRPELGGLAGVVLVTSVMTSYTKARAENLGPELRGGLIERGERVGALILGGVTGWMVPFLAALALGGAITVAQRFAVARRQLEEAERRTPAPQAAEE